VPTVAARLNADPAAYPPPPGTHGWADSTVRGILSNPKYTGHQVFGRRYHAPVNEWLWSPQPVHEPIVDMQTRREAQETGAEHATSRDHDGPPANPAGR
jgi:site-specific DNA recombinase